MANSWRATDNGRWWLRSTSYSEPNGDYTANCLMGGGSVTSATDITFNDMNCGYSSGNYYICSTNDFNSGLVLPAPAPFPSLSGLVGMYSAEGWDGSRWVDASGRWVNMYNTRGAPPASHKAQPSKSHPKKILGAFGILLLAFQKTNHARSICYPAP